MVEGVKPGFAAAELRGLDKEPHRLEHSTGFGILLSSFSGYAELFVGGSKELVGRVSNSCYSFSSRTVC